MGASNSKQNAQRTNATPLQAVQTFGGESDDLDYESNNNSNNQMGGRRRRGKKTRRGSKKHRKSRKSRK